jgi:hypothetical protein
MDEQRSGRPSTSADLLQDTERAMQADRRVSVVQLEIRLNMSGGAIWNISHKRLGYRYVCSRWVPRQLKKKNACGHSSMIFIQRYEEHS